MSSQPQFKHQEFSISNSQRKRIVRQDRHFTGQSKHIVRTHAKDFEVDNYSAFGVALKGDDAYFASTKAFSALYLVNGHEICNIDLKYIRKDETGLIAFSIEGQPLAVEAIQAIEKTYEVIRQFESGLVKYKDLPISFKHAALELKSWLENLQQEVSTLEKTTFETSLRELQNYEEGIAQTISEYIEREIPRFIVNIHQGIKDLPHKEVKLCYDFLRTQVGHIFFKSTYGHRAYSKPRGYAGDYEMMNNVYLNELRGESLFAKCVQRFFTDSFAGKAVRNRVVFLNEKIQALCLKTENPKILSVASGPAREIQKLFSENPELASKCEIHLLDQDDEALKFAQREIFEICRAKKVKANIHLHNLAIKNVISEGLPTADFDLIYSAGLFDYFTDAVAQFAANQLFLHLKKGGHLIIGNFNTNNPNQFVMEAIGDWYLIYRDQQSLKDLYSSISSKINVEQEKEGVNIFAVMEK